MVCCFAVLQHACRHNTLLKIGCTKDCDDFCEPRETLLVTKFRWLCGPCVEVQGSREDEERELAYAAEPRLIEERIAHIKNLQLKKRHKEEMLYDLRTRLGGHARLASMKRANRIREAGDAELWTHEYAENIWQLKYAECEDAGAFEHDLLNLKEFKPWDLDIVRESKWDADYAEESNDRIVPQSGSSIAGASETTDLSRDYPASTLAPGPATHELTAEPLAPAAQRSPINTSAAPLVAPQPTPVQRNNLSDRELMPQPPLPKSLVRKSMPLPALPTQQRSPEKLLSPTPSSANQTPSPTLSTREHCPDMELPMSPGSC